jgi:hypothetical protein
MLLVLLVSAVFAVLAPVAGTIAVSEARIARSHAVQNTALHIAEAGVELALARLRAEPGFTTTTVNPINGELNGGSFSVDVFSEAPGPGEVMRRRIAATGRWGGGQQRAAVRVIFTQTPLQSFLFQHAFLSGGTAKIRNSVISGPVRLHALDNESSGNTFDHGQPVTGNIYDSLIPLVNFSYYQGLAGANPSLWHVTTTLDLDQAVNAANSLGRQRILVNAGDDDVTLDAPVNFTGLIVIQADEVRIRRDINAGQNHQNNPLVILTTGDIDVRPGQGHRVDTLGNSTLLYSNGTVALTRSQGGGVRQLTGIIIAKKGGASPRDLWNANLAFNNAMLPLLERDAQPEFRETPAIVMHVEYIKP